MESHDQGHGHGSPSLWTSHSAGGPRAGVHDGLSVMVHFWPNGAHSAATCDTPPHRCDTPLVPLCTNLGCCLGTGCAQAVQARCCASPICSVHRALEHTHRATSTSLHPSSASRHAMASPKPLLAPGGTTGCGESPPCPVCACMRESLECMNAQVATDEARARPHLNQHEHRAVAGPPVTSAVCPVRSYVE